MVDESKMSSTLAERGGRYGNWREQALIAQNIKDAMRDSANWPKLPAYMRETLDMNANKIARMLNGDFMYLDNWHDMVGYTKLAEDCTEQDLAGGVTGPRVIDLDHADIPEIFNYLAESKVSPEDYVDFCREYSIAFPLTEEEENNSGS